MLPGDRRKPTRSSVSLMLTTRGPVYWKGTGEKINSTGIQSQKDRFPGCRRNIQGKPIIQPNAGYRERTSVSSETSAGETLISASAVSHCGNDVESEWGSPLIIIRYCVSLREPQFRSFIHSGALLCSVSTFRPVGKLD